MLFDRLAVEVDREPLLRDIDCCSNVFVDSLRGNMKDLAKDVQLSVVISCTLLLDISITLYSSECYEIFQERVAGACPAKKRGISV